MTSRPSLTQERLRELLDYNPDTGQFTWKVRRSRCADKGSIAGCVDKHGYICIKIDQKRYFAHRLALFWANGEWPPDETDHINRDPKDNRLANLRPASRKLNALNTGARGYTRIPHLDRWAVYLSGKYVGRYDTEREARNAYLSARQRAAEALTGEVAP